MKVTMQVTRNMTAFLAVFVLVGSAGCTGSGLEGGSAGQTPPANNPGQPQTPGMIIGGTHQPSNPSSEIIGVRPPGGSQNCPTPQVGVDLRLTDAMRNAEGSFDLSTVTLTLDGKDVTRESNVLGTLTYPQNQASLSYTPKTALAVGTHQASFIYPSVSGRSTFEWTFTVADIPCP